MRASHQARPETLLAAVGAFPAGVVILPPAVLAQEERPFQPPLLASAHRQSCSGTSRPGFREVPIPLGVSPAPFDF